MRSQPRPLEMVPILLLGLLMLVLGSIPAAPGHHEEAEQAAEIGEGSYGQGLVLFQRYCRTCHGKEAKGDGTVAQYLKVQPTDLTQLTANNGGEFPGERVLNSIDGREEVPLHGREMPIWGAVFQADEGQTEADAQQKLWDVIAYIEGIQEPAEETSSD